MNEIKIENEYRDRVLELNSQQALLIGYNDPADLFQNINALGTVGIIKEISDENYKESFALNVSKEGFHIGLHSLIGITEEDEKVNILIVGMTDAFFNNKDFEFIMSDTLYTVVKSNVDILRIIIINSDGLAIKIDVSIKAYTGDNTDDLVKKVSGIVEIAITKILKMDLTNGSDGSLNDGIIMYKVTNLGSDYIPDTYYLIDKENIQNTRLIRLGDEDGEE